MRSQYDNIRLDHSTKRAPEPSSALVKHKCSVCGGEFMGTRTQKVCGPICKAKRSAVWRKKTIDKQREKRRASKYGG